MNRSLDTLFLWLVLVAVAAPGCAGWKKPSCSFWPFGKVSDTVPGITPPPERMRQIRQMASQAARQGPAEQQRVAAELAEMYPNQRDPLIRGEIVRAAGSLSGPAAIALLREGLKDSDPDVRVLACRSLGKLGGPEASLALRETLGSDTDPDVRLAAARALGETRDPQAVASLGAALEDRDPAMQYRAVGSLRQVAPVDLGNDVERWRHYVRGEPPPPEKPFSLTETLRGMF
ncbi:MAG: HEAT repeat domain-containing protein [Thermoguttaceae bacterium]|jgi:HEAT repeat protein|nr:HEAT repeat domain-containing protein [Thermoguttaceae bacterium]